MRQWWKLLSTPAHEQFPYCFTTASIALNLEFPFFMAVSAMECSLAKSSAPPSVRKQPLTFCFILIFPTPRSLALSKSCDNYIERIQRYISLSRRNSMFFGSHEGASRAAILYSIAISCRLNGINLFEYICDVIEKTAEWQPNTPLEKYRNLLPDRWKKQ